MTPPDRRSRPGGELADMVAIVTGASQGQGASHARRFVAEGAKVGLVDVLDEAGEQLAHELGDAAMFLHLDVSDEPGWADVVDEIVGRWGRIDVLINNAGIIGETPMPMHSCDATTFQRILAVNVTGMFLGIKTTAPAMERAGGGSIVNVSSIMGLRGSTNVAYGTSKWAVRGLTKSAAVDLARADIRVNAVLPGFVDTPMFRLHGSGRNIDDFLARSGQRLLVPRVGTSEEVTEAVLFLASDRARYVTGTDIVVDGGWTVT